MSSPPSPYEGRLRRMTGWLVMLGLNLWHFSLLAFLDTWAGLTVSQDAYEVALIATLGSVPVGLVVIELLVRRRDCTSA